MDEIDELLPTRKSLLSRLKNWDDQESWQLFLDTYGKLIYGTAVKAGLKDPEAQDVVQETVIRVCKSMKDFRYREQNGSFKSWLLQLTRWRIADQFGKRQKNISQLSEGSATRTSTIDRIPDPAEASMEEEWQEEWERNLLDAAIRRVRRKIDPSHYQVYDLHVLKEWPVTRVARFLNLSSGSIYLIKYRINKLIKKEISHLQRKSI